MKVLYISTVCSKNKYKQFFELSDGNLLHSIQNFHSSIINSLQNNDITVLSGPQFSHKNIKKKIFKYEKEKDENNKYIYPFFINVPILKHFFIFIFMLIETIFWILKNKNEDSKIIVDSAYVTITPMLVFLAKFFSIPITAIVADIYDYMSTDIEINKKRSIVKRICCSMQKFCWNNYSSFIFLTEKMNNILNKKNKPYIVIEGFAPNLKRNNKISKKKKKIIIYSGSLMKKYGVLNLIEAFEMLKDKSFELHFYGNGELEKEITKISKTNKSIKYMGNISRELLFEKYQEAFLLVNPRGNDEEYTLYSFPSKTIDYMMSGTPVLTVQLDGIPKEYYDYLFTISDNNPTTIYQKICDISKKSDNLLKSFGNSASNFINNKKNYNIQGNKINELLTNTVNNDTDYKFKIFELISLCSITFLSVFPNGSNKYLLLLSIILWFTSIIIYDKEKFVKFLKNNQILIFCILLWLVNYFFNYIFGHSDMLCYFFLTYIRISIAFVISLYYIQNKINIINKHNIAFLLTLVNVINLYTIFRNLEYYNLSRILSTGFDLGINTFGIASYTYIYGLIFLVISIIGLIISGKKKFKWYIYLTLFTSIIVIFVTEFLIAIILTVLGVLCHLLKLYDFKRIFILIITLIVFILLFSLPLSKTCHYFADKFEHSPNLSTRFDDIGYFLTGEIDKSVDLKIRFEVYSQSINSFINNPILGIGYSKENINNNLIGNHSTLIDEFAKYGIFGSIPLLLVIITMFSSIFKSLNKQISKNIYFVCIIIFSIFMALNNALFVTLLYFIFLIVPIMLKINEEFDLNENTLDS